MLYILQILLRMHACRSVVIGRTIWCPVAERMCLLQSAEQGALRQRAAELEGLLSAAQKRSADLAAELAAVLRQQPCAQEASIECEQLARLQGSRVALSKCSLGQLYRSVALHSCQS